VRHGIHSHRGAGDVVPVLSQVSKMFFPKAGRP
jgi:hypothetical protein